MGGGSSKKKAPEEGADDLVELTFKSVHSAIRWNKPLAQLTKYYIRDPAAVSMQDDRNGNFPIHIAAQNGFTPQVQLLLEHGGDINAINGKGNTALHMAWSYDYIETAEQLVKSGANVNLANDAGFRACMGIDGDKSGPIVYLLAAKTSEEVLAALTMAENSPEDTEKGNFVSKCMAFKKKLAKDAAEGGGESSVWTAECDDRMKQVMDKLS